LINYAKLFADEIAPLLTGTERVLAAGPFHKTLIGDDSGFHRPTELMGRSERKIRERYGDPQQPEGLVSYDPAAGFEVNQAGIDRLVGGVSAEGGAQSAAARMLVARMRGHGEYYVVTDQRLLLVNPVDPRHFTVAFELPRQAVVSARLAAKVASLQFGRVELRFTDGSALAFLAGGMLSRGRARAVVAALNG
jgi:hypothetical protein